MDQCCFFIVLIHSQEEREGSQNLEWLYYWRPTLHTSLFIYIKQFIAFGDRVCLKYRLSWIGLSTLY